MTTSIRHEGPILLLGERPDLLIALLGRRLRLDLPRSATIALASADFTQAVPVERRADAVVIVEDEGRITRAFVVEVQLARDDDKRFSWPLYLASLHARVRCPTFLVVLALDDGVAKWARSPIATLQPTSPLIPLVLGPREIPRVTSAAVARRMPELAVLSALIHGHEPNGAAVVQRAALTLAELDDVRARTYNDLLWSSLGDVARAALEALMSLRNYEYKSDFARKYVAEGHAEGRTEEARRILLVLMAARGLGPSEAARARVEGCTDLDTLERWICRVVTSRSEDDLFAEP